MVVGAGGRRLADVKAACSSCEGCWEPLGVRELNHSSATLREYRKLQVTAEKSSSSSRLRLLGRFSRILVSYWPLARIPNAKAAPRGREESSVVLGHVPSRPLGIANTS